VKACASYIIVNMNNMKTDYMNIAIKLSLHEKKARISRKPRMSHQQTSNCIFQGDCLWVTRKCHNSEGRRSVCSLTSLYSCSFRTEGVQGKQIIVYKCMAVK